MKSSWIENLALAGAAALFLSLVGCTTSKDVLGLTEASYEEGKWFYKSNKNQESLDATLSRDAQGNPTFKIKTTATTPEAAILAVAQLRYEEMKLIHDMIDKLVAQLAAGASKGAGS